MDKQPFTYFVSYAHGRGFGSMELYRSNPIASWADVEDVAHAAILALAEVMPQVPIRKSDIVILNWILLSSPEED